MSTVFALLPLVMISAQPSPPAVVLPRQAVAQGWTLDRLQRAYGRMCAPPLDDLDFAMSDVNFKLARRFTEYSGDISGRLLQALISAGAAIGQDSVMVGQMMSLMGTYQKPDGHFGADQDLVAGIQGNRDMPILWGNSRLLLAFTLRYERTKDVEALKLARGIGDYIVGTRPYLGKPENLKLNGVYAAGYTTCYPALIEGMARLAEVSGDNRYLDEARHIARVALQDTSFDKHHSHGRLAAYRGMLEIDRIGKTSEFLSAVSAGVAKVNADLILPTGGVTEVFDRDYIMDEGCSEVDWIMTNVLLWRATGETAYLDTAEFALRNHLLATQFSNGGFGHHGLSAIKFGGKTWPAGGIGNAGAESYWCCAQHGTQMLGDLTRWAVASDGESVYITFLVEAQATVMVKQRPVKVRVRENKPGLWEIQITAEMAGPVAMKLRVPKWQKGLKLDGRSMEGQQGWLTQSVTVATTAKLTVQFADKVTLLRPFDMKAANEMPARIAVGADMYCLPDAFVPDGFLPVDSLPTVWMVSNRSFDGEIPVVVQGGAGAAERIRTRLVPMMNRPAGACVYLFDVKSIKPEALDAVQEYLPRTVPLEVLFACGGESELFINGKSVGNKPPWDGLGRFEMWLDRKLVDVAIKVPSDSGKPSLMAVVNVDGHTQATDTTHWAAVRCPMTLPADGLTDGSLDRVQPAKMTDLGGLGDGPRKLIHAEFTGRGARWICPGAADATGKQCWLFRCIIKAD